MAIWSKFNPFSHSRKETRSQTAPGQDHTPSKHQSSGFEMPPQKLRSDDEILRFVSMTTRNFRSNRYGPFPAPEYNLTEAKSDPTLARPDEHHDFFITFNAVVHRFIAKGTTKETSEMVTVYIGSMHEGEPNDPKAVDSSSDIYVIHYSGIWRDNNPPLTWPGVWISHSWIESESSYHYLDNSHDFLLCPSYDMFQSLPVKSINSLISRTYDAFMVFPKSKGSRVVSKYWIHKNSSQVKEKIEHFFKRPKSTNYYANWPVLVEEDSGLKTLCYYGSREPSTIDNLRCQDFDHISRPGTMFDSTASLDDRMRWLKEHVKFKLVKDGPLRKDKEQLREDWDEVLTWYMGELHHGDNSKVGGLMASLKGKTFATFADLQREYYAWCEDQ